MPDENKIVHIPVDSNEDAKMIVDTVGKYLPLDFEFEDKYGDSIDP